MSESPDVARSLALLAQAVASYEPPSREASHKLAPYREMLVSLREKGASLRTIEKILSGCGVIASHHSVARYLRSVSSDKRAKLGDTKRSRARAAVRATAPETAHEPSERQTREPAPVASPVLAHTPSTAQSREASPPPSPAPARTTSPAAEPAPSSAPPPPASQPPAQRTAPPPPPFPSPRVRGPRIADVRNL